MKRENPDVAINAALTMSGKSDTLTRSGSHRHHTYSKPSPIRMEQALASIQPAPSEPEPRALLSLL